MEHDFLADLETNLKRLARLKNQRQGMEQALECVDREIFALEGVVAYINSLVKERPNVDCRAG